MDLRHRASDRKGAGRRRLRVPAAGLAVAALASAAAAVNVPKSRYSAITLASCAEQAPAAAGRTWLCEGLPGYPVHIAEREGRYFVSAGGQPETRRAALQSLGVPNTIFARPAGRMTIEWRVRRAQTRDEPYATIVRYFTQRPEGVPAGGRRGEVLVVSKVGPAETCQIARIDALANPEAISLARSAADEFAATFDCKSEPRIVGATGRSPM